MTQYNVAKTIQAKNTLSKTNLNIVQDKPSIDTTEEYARVIEWTPAWDFGAPCPQVFTNGLKTFLIYMINEPNPNWDGSYSTQINPSSDTTYLLALVEFIYAHSHRFGIVNDEAVGGHPLYNKGLEPYAAHIIENSTWISELKQIHKIHPYYNELRWLKLNHYLLFFHDDILEIVAHDYRTELHKSTFKDLAVEVARRLNS